MLAKVTTTTIVGVEAFEVDVEVDISAGLPSFSIVGLPDTAVKESKERVKSAITNAGFSFPTKRVVVNLAPADLKKEGGSFDFPIAIAILTATKVIPENTVKEVIFTGELSLDAKIKHVGGVLASALFARNMCYKAVIVPNQNLQEASYVDGILAYGADNIVEAVLFLQGKGELKKGKTLKRIIKPEYDVDFNEVRGQETAKRALEIAAAGGHNVLMIGPPGSGKTMLARRLPTILPPMSFEEAIETTKIYSCSGYLNKKNSFIFERPFRDPHHTISDVALIGGGTYPRPGEVSLAHGGVLFLDELPEFKKNVLEVLRQPLEDRFVTISRASQTVSFPSSFILVASMNPCPCGWLGANDTKKHCICTPLQITRYRRKISGPLLDRIDIQIEVPALKFSEMAESDNNAEPSNVIAERVEKTKEIQYERFKSAKFYSNSEMSGRWIKKYCEISSDSAKLMQDCVERLGFTARAYTKVLKVARTIADIERCDKIMPQHISEAISLRILDRKLDF